MRDEKEPSGVRASLTAAGVLFRRVDTPMGEDLEILGAQRPVLRGVRGTLRLAMAPLPKELLEARNTQVLFDHLVRSQGLARNQLTIVCLPRDRQIGWEGCAWISDDLGSLAAGLRSEGLGYVRTKMLARLERRWTNPYQSQVAVSEDMFFGRADDLADLTAHHENFLVVGPRRSGKTSLVLRALAELRANHSYRHLLDDTHTEPRYLYTAVFVDTNAAEGPTQLWDLVLRGMGLEQRDVTGGLYWKRLFGSSRQIGPRSPFEVVAALLKTKHRRTVLFLDEADSLLRLDEQGGWLEMAKLRTLVDDESARVRVVLSGYDGLYRAARTSSFPLHGRMSQKRIANLAPVDVQELISVPMQEVGITCEDPQQSALRIYNITGGMPNLVQDLCRLIVLDLPAGDRITITVPMLEGYLKRHAAQLTDQVVGAFHEIGDPLPRLIAYLAAVGNGEVNAIDSLAHIRRQTGLGELSDQAVRQAIEYLFLHNILQSQDEEDYVFASAILRERLEREMRRRGARELIESLTRGVTRKYGAQVR
jgi:hypothetical protein